MKRNVLSLLLVLALCLTLSVGVFAAADVSGRYQAVECKQDGVSYNCENEYLQLNADGTGTVTFGGTPYSIEWTLSGSEFSFVDEEGYGMEGSCRGGVISGNYAGYDFVYEAESGAAPTPAPTPTPEPTPEPGSGNTASAQELAAAAGTYQAVSCEKDGKSYVCDEDAIVLDADGTGTVLLNGMPFTMEWALSGEDFTFVDEDGDIMEGRLSDGVITGSYAGYTYRYERSEASPLDLTAVPGTYYPVSSTQDGYTYSVQSEYLVLNEDGSAMLVYSNCAFPSTWTLSGDAFTLQDNRGGTMTGTLSLGTLVCDYFSYRYEYRKGPDAAVMALSPETWGKGLPYVVDEAGILSSGEVSRLTDTAQSLAAKYNCGVYIVTLDDMAKFSPSGNVETCAEEIRVGYDLGLGSARNCILLLMSMADRSYDLCVFGDAADEAFNEYARSTIEKAMLDDFRGNDWYAGFADYQEQCGTLLDMDESGRPMSAQNDPARRVGAVFASVLLGFVIALIFCLIKRGKMKSVAEQRRATNYIPDAGVNLAYQHDQFVNSTVVRVYDPPAERSGGSGGGGHSSSGHSHSSGHF